MKKEKLPLPRKIYMIISKIIDIVMIPIIVISIFCCVVMFNAKRQNVLPNVFGFSAVIIKTGSMEASGFYKGRSVIVRHANPKGLKSGFKSDGDIIAFYYFNDTDFGLYDPYSFPKYTNEEASKHSKYGTLTAEYILGIRDAEILKAAKAQSNIYFHQIKDIRQAPDGTLWFLTQGTSNPLPDASWIKEDYVLGVYEETPLLISSIINFVSSADGIIWVVIIPIAVLMFMLVFEFIDNWDRYETEQKLVKGELYLTDKQCIKKQIGYGMQKKNKLLILANAPAENRTEYVKLMWKDGEVPKGLMRFIQKQNWSDRETEKFNALKNKLAKQYTSKNAKEIVSAYEKALKQYNELDFKIRGEYHIKSPLTDTTEERIFREKTEKEIEDI